MTRLTRLVVSALVLGALLGVAPTPTPPPDPCAGALTCHHKYLPYVIREVHLEMQGTPAP